MSRYENNSPRTPGRTDSEALIAAEDYAAAIDKLTTDIRQKMGGSNGGNPNNDWLLDPFYQTETIKLIDALIRTLEIRLEM